MKRIKYCYYLTKKLDGTMYCKFYKKKICTNDCRDCTEKCYKIFHVIKQRTKELGISKKVKLTVWERDHHECIFCHKRVEWNYANSHFIKRSQGGLGIEQNIITNCEECHHKFDDTSKRQEMLKYAETYLKTKYINWNKNDLIYKKRYRK